MNEGMLYACMSRYIICMCVLLCNKRWTVLGDEEDTTINKEPFDEHKALQQALFLVELLKSEYSRVLQENNVMQRNRVLWEERAATCVTEAKKGKNQATVMPQVHKRTVQQPILAPGRRWRWRPARLDSNVYYDVPARRKNYDEDFDDKENVGGWRRFQYEDAFGPQPGGTKAKVSLPTDATSQSTVNGSKTISESTASPPTSITENDSILTESQSSSVVTTPKTTKVITSVTANTIKETVTRPSTTLNHGNKKQKLSFSRKITSTTHHIANSNESGKKNTMSSTSVSRLPSSKGNLVTQKKIGEKVKLSDHATQATDIEVGQAAAELDKELNDNFKNWKSDRPNGMPRKIPKLWRPSTRVHLARSTRYQIPLPENHAFCFTNPDNALCRTFI